MCVPVMALALQPKSYAPSGVAFIGHNGLSRSLGGLWPPKCYQPFDERLSSLTAEKVLSILPAHAAGAMIKYKSNPKHSEPWQHGRRGSLCPREVRPLVNELLQGSVLHGSKRYATHDGKAYCAQESHDDVWHGYPVAWKEVPPPIVRSWKKDRVVSRRDVRIYWHGGD